MKIQTSPLLGILDLHLPPHHRQEIQVVSRCIGLSPISLVMSCNSSPLGSAPETVSLAQFLRDRNTSNEITGLGLERLTGSSELKRNSPFRPFSSLPVSTATVKSLVCVLHQAVHSSRTQCESNRSTSDLTRTA